MLWRTLPVRYKNKSGIRFHRYALFILWFINSPCSWFVFAHSKRKLMTFPFIEVQTFSFCGLKIFEWQIFIQAPNSDLFHAAEKLGQREETARWSTSFLTFKMKTKGQTPNVIIAVMLSYLNLLFFFFYLPFKERAKIRLTSFKKYIFPQNLKLQYSRLPKYNFAYY